MDFTLADHLANLRRAHGYSQEGLAAELGLTRQAISRWERGESLPDTENLIALADLYGVTLDELVHPDPASTEASASEAHQGSAQEAPAAQSYLSPPDGASTVPAGVIGPVIGAESAPSQHTGSSRAGIWVARIVLGCLGVLVLLALGTCALVRLYGLTDRHTEQTTLALKDTMVDAEQVHSLQINWRAGSVEVIAEDDIEDVYLTEEYPNQELSAYPLGLEVTEHNELIVDHCLPDPSLGEGTKGKRLTVRIPRRLAQSLGVVSCVMASGQLDMSDLTCEKLDLQLGSGEVDARDIVADSLKVQVGAGDALVNGTFSKSVDADVQSGRARITSDVVPASTELGATSGSIEYRLPRDASFILRAESTSGSVDVEYKATQEGDTYLVGRRGNPIEAHVTSGNITIRPR